jgi:hypothetical protein
MILIVHAQDNLRDDRAAFPINDRLSLMRFLGLGLTERLPVAKMSLGPSRERLTGAGRHRGAVCPL